jgi:hypothetical protein
VSGQIGQPQTLTQLYAVVQDSAPADSITPNFLRNLLASVTVVPGGIGWGLVATGSGIGSALPLAQPLNYFSTVPLSTGAVLPAAATQLGVEYIIWNGGINNLHLYAAAGDTIIAVPGVTNDSSIVVGNGQVARLTALAPGYWALTVGPTAP